jgi:hypothetical protein
MAHPPRDLARRPRHQPRIDTAHQRQRHATEPAQPLRGSRSLAGPTPGRLTDSELIDAPAIDA